MRTHLYESYYTTSFRVAYTRSQRTLIGRNKTPFYWLIGVRGPNSNGGHNCNATDERWATTGNTSLARPEYHGRTVMWAQPSNWKARRPWGREGTRLMGRHYILPTKTTSIERDWDWILNNLKVVTEDSRKMYGWYARTTEHPNTRSDVLTTEPPGQGSSVSEVGILLYQ